MYWWDVVILKYRLENTEQVKLQKLKPEKNNYFICYRQAHLSTSGADPRERGTIAPPQTAVDQKIASRMHQNSPFWARKSKFGKDGTPPPYTLSPSAPRSSRLRRSISAPRPQASPFPTATPSGSAQGPHPSVSPVLVSSIMSTPLQTFSNGSAYLLVHVPTEDAWQTLTPCASDRPTWCCNVV